MVYLGRPLKYCIIEYDTKTIMNTQDKKKTKNTLKKSEQK